MCGIFGFISKTGEPPELAHLRRIAVATQTRGEHAFGLAWIEADGTIQTVKHIGPAASHLEELERCHHAIVVIGHCRYATHGTPLDNRNNHPHVAGGGYIAHNGVVLNYRDLVQRHQLQQRTECDSEVLGLLMARHRGTITQRAAWASNQAQGDLAILGIWSNPARLMIARRGRPLHFSDGRTGFYFGSLANGLPGTARVAADQIASTIVYQGNRIGFEGQAIRLGDGQKLPHPNIV